jgi:regulator of sirC expression with transglutaminase-like and TPR domain
VLRRERGRRSVKVEFIELREYILMDTMVTELEQKYKTTEKLDPHALQEELAMLADKVISKTENLLKYPADFEKVASELLSEIKNNYEVAKYIAGLILAFFDLSENRFRRPLNLTFNLLRSKMRSWGYQKMII